MRLAEAPIRGRKILIPTIRWQSRRIATGGLGGAGGCGQLWDPVRLLSSLSGIIDASAALERLQAPSSDRGI